MSRAPALIVPAVKQHTATVIFAHGLGDSGAGWMDLATNWRRRGKFDHVKFVFPNAPNIPITVNFGMTMPGWYDIMIHFEDRFKKGFDDLAEASQDENGVLRSRDTFANYIKEEMSAGIASTRIVLGGFSQGGAVALVTGLTQPNRLAGVVGMSCYLPIANRIPALIEAIQPAPSKEVPFWMAHGEADPLVKLEWATRTRDKVREMGWQVQWKTYAGLQHSADPQEIDDLEKWLDQRLPEAVGSAAASSSKA